MLNIKHLCLGICLFVSSLNFSFYKLEELYCDFDPSVNTAKIVRFSDWKEMDRTDPISFFLYDKNTFNQLHLMVKLSKITNVDEDLALPHPNLLKFLNCDFNWDSNFFNPSLGFLGRNVTGAEICYRKQSLLFKEDGSIKREDSGYYKDKDKTIYSASLFTTKNFCLEDHIPVTNITNDYMKIISTFDGVKLIAQDDAGKVLKEVDMTEALQHYFVKEVSELDSDKFAENLSKSSKVYASPILSQKELTPALNLHDYGRKSLSKENHDRLQSSIILAIWALVPKYNEKDQVINSGIIGLARDNRTKKLYHWTTDLGQDISVLMNYESNKKKS